MLSTTLTIARFTSIEVLRGRLLPVLALALLVAAGSAWFVASLAITETGAYRAAMLAATLRIMTVVLVALYTAAGMVRDYQEKTLELVLAGAVTRVQYFIGRLAGFSLIAVICTAAAAVVMLSAGPAPAVLDWSARLLLELLLVTAASMTAVVTFRQLPPALAATGLFYVAARALSALELLSRSTLAGAGDVPHALMAGVIQALGYLLPELSRFAAAGLFIDGEASADLAAVLLETLVYLALLCAVGLTDFYRQNL